MVEVLPELPVKDTEPKYCGGVAQHYLADHDDFLAGDALRVKARASWSVLNRDTEKHAAELVMLCKVTVEWKIMQRRLEGEKRLDRIDKAVQKLERIKAKSENTL
ncbi:hypothetical protein PG985_003773 [Apiospora marii]|uniref:Uncharacterized protein n=1 Tax=Apiospora marii TaxID=335849 RepID=A0ABR1SIU7_9PEZI